MHARKLGSVALFFIVACGGGEPPPPSTPTAASATPPSGPDTHGIAPDEVLISKVALPDDWSATIQVQVGRAEKPVDPGTEGTFFPGRGGGEWKTKFFWKSHVATKAELKPGAVAACFADAYKDSAYFAPTPENGHKGNWVLGHVSDAAELEKGLVKVGNSHCHLDAVRIIGS
jgi:hypothetical protein